ncbi:MAG: exopolyphosphatase [Pseudomonadota bacterium]
MASKARSRLRSLLTPAAQVTSSHSVRPIAVIDIGSNSVRLVVFDGLQRSPQTLFNEKVMCGLGKELQATGRMPEEAIDSACAALRRYNAIISDMACDTVCAVATAAVRDAANGAAFIERVRSETGIDVEVVDGAGEARYSGLGVLSGIPEANGIVGDLGGGSLELIRVADGQMHERVTLPIGPVRLIGDPKADLRSRRKTIDKALKSVEWLRSYPGVPFYVVGGSWRALARIHIQRSKHPLGILHQHEMTPEDVSKVYRLVRRIRPEELGQFENVPQRRVEALPAAARILDRVVAITGASKVIVSALGLREGILYEQLEPDVRERDPLIAACRQISKRSSRFGGHGDALMEWMDPLFAQLGEDAPNRRLRHAAALMSDIGWRGHPDFRAESAIYDSLFGWFVAIDGPGRAAIGLSLFVNYGAKPSDELGELAQKLLSPQQTQWALQVGYALRLANRLSAGTHKPLKETTLLVSEGTLSLTLNKEGTALYGEVVERRLSDLAKACGLASGGAVFAG